MHILIYIHIYLALVLFVVLGLGVKFSYAVAVGEKEKDTVLISLCENCLQMKNSIRDRHLLLIWGEEGKVFLLKAARK